MEILLAAHLLAFRPCMKNHSLILRTFWPAGFTGRLTLDTTTNDIPADQPGF
jgi:hypothetical protein